jgi:hypothetical protein
VTRLPKALGRGVLFLGWKVTALYVALGVPDYVASLGYDYLNHGPYRLFLRSPIDQALRERRRLEPHPVHTRF